MLAPSAGRGQACWYLPPAGVRPVGAFFRVPEVTFGRLALTKPILQKSLFRRGEMAVLVVSGSWPELRIGAKTAAKKSDAYLGPVPSGVTTFWGAAKKKIRLFFVDILGLLYGLDLGKKSLGASWPSSWPSWAPSWPSWASSWPSWASSWRSWASFCPCPGEPAGRGHRGRGPGSPGQGSLGA